MTTTFSLSEREVKNSSNLIVGVVGIVRATDAAVNSNMNGYADKEVYCTATSSLSTDAKRNMVLQAASDGNLYNAAENALNVLLYGNTQGNEEVL